VHPDILLHCCWGKFFVLTLDASLQYLSSPVHSRFSIPGNLRNHVSSVIIALSSTGKSLREIADALEISESAVAYWQQRFRETGELKRKSDTGGKPKYNREDIVNIRSAVPAKPITTAQGNSG
jgi:hypothetical protein